MDFYQTHRSAKGTSNAVTGPPDTILPCLTEKWIDRRQLMKKQPRQDCRCAVWVYIWSWVRDTWSFRLSCLRGTGGPGEARSSQDILCLQTEDSKCEREGWGYSLEFPGCPILNAKQYTHTHTHSFL